jgi:hypothetical protein
MHSLKLRGWAFIRRNLPQILKNPLKCQNFLCADSGMKQVVLDFVFGRGVLKTAPIQYSFPPPTARARPSPGSLHSPTHKSAFVNPRPLGGTESIKLLSGDEISFSDDENPDASAPLAVENTPAIEIAALPSISAVDAAQFRSGVKQLPRAIRQSEGGNRSFWFDARQSDEDSETTESIETSSSQSARSSSAQSATYSSSSHISEGHLQVQDSHVDPSGIRSDSSDESVDSDS